eukprot:scaffold9579_cov42-Phaeocystis_antarctica.AAC.2
MGSQPGMHRVHSLGCTGLQPQGAQGYSHTATAWLRSKSLTWSQLNGAGTPPSPRATRSEVPG